MGVNDKARTDLDLHKGSNLGMVIYAIERSYPKTIKKYAHLWKFKHCANADTDDADRSRRQWLGDDISSPGPKSQQVKNGQIFERNMFSLSLYLRNAATSTPIKRCSNGPAYEMCKKRWKKGREREWDRRKNGESNSKRKKHTKKQHIHVNTLSHRDPCAMTFCECKILAVPDCEE